eukprot:s167_g18.t2
MGLAHGIHHGLDQEEPKAMMPPTLQQFSNDDADAVIVIEDTSLSPDHECVVTNTSDICNRRMKRRRVLDNLVQKFHAQGTQVPDVVKELVVQVFSDALCDKMPKRQFESQMYLARSCLLLSD